MKLLIARSFKVDSYGRVSEDGLDTQVMFLPRDHLLSGELGGSTVKDRGERMGAFGLDYSLEVLLEEYDIMKLQILLNFSRTNIFFNVMVDGMFELMCADSLIQSISGHTRVNLDFDCWFFCLLGY